MGALLNSLAPGASEREERVTPAVVAGGGGGRVAGGRASGLNAIYIIRASPFSRSRCLA